jgi:hypothetical protein
MYMVLCAPNTVTNTVYDIEVRLRRTADAQIAQLGRETARESRGATVATVRRTRSTHDGAAPSTLLVDERAISGFDGPPQPSPHISKCPV